MSDPVAIPAGSAALVLTGALTVTGSVLGIPADAIGASVAGAALALGVADRIDVTLVSSLRVLKSFLLSLACGVFLGPLVGLGVDHIINKWIGLDLPDGLMRPAACLIVALGAQRLMPLWLDLLARVLTAWRAEKKT